MRRCCSEWSRPISCCARLRRSPELHRRAVEFADLQLIEIALGHAAQVDLDHRAVGPVTFGERRASAGGAELVADRVLVESVLPHLTFGPFEGDLVGRGEVMDVALAPANRAIAGHARAG